MGNQEAYIQNITKKSALVLPFSFTPYIQLFSGLQTYIQKTRDKSTFLLNKQNILFLCGFFNIKKTNATFDFTEKHLYRCQMVNIVYCLKKQNCPDASNNTIPIQLLKFQVSEGSKKQNLVSNKCKTSYNVHVAESCNLPNFKCSLLSQLSTALKKKNKVKTFNTGTKYGGCYIFPITHFPLAERM